MRVREELKQLYLLFICAFKKCYKYFSLDLQSVLSDSFSKLECDFTKVRRDWAWTSLF